MIFFLILSLIVGYMGAFLIHFYTSEAPFSLKFIRNRSYLVLSFALSFLLLLSLGFYEFGSEREIFIFYGILMLLFVLGMIDIKCLAIPDALNLLLLMMCVVYAFIQSGYGFIDRVLIGFGVGGIFFAFKIFYQSLAHKDIMGEADIIVLSSIGIAFNVPTAFVSVFIGSIVALLYAIILVILSKATLENLKLPFVFFIFVGVLVHYSLNLIGIL